jgi:hypothetical protein
VAPAEPVQSANNRHNRIVEAEGCAARSDRETSGRRCTINWVVCAARIHDEYGIRVRKVKASYPVETACLPSDAGTVLVKRCRTDKEKLASIDVEMLCPRAMEPSSAPAQPVESTFGCQPLSTEGRDRSVEPECVTEKEPGAARKHTRSADRSLGFSLGSAGVEDHNMVVPAETRTWHATRTARQPRNTRPRCTLERAYNSQLANIDAILGHALPAGRIRHVCVDLRTSCTCVREVGHSRLQELSAPAEPVLSSASRYRLVPKQPQRTMWTNVWTSHRISRHSKVWETIHGHARRDRYIREIRNVCIVRRWRNIIEIDAACFQHNEEICRLQMYPSDREAARLASDTRPPLLPITVRTAVDVRHVPT